MCNSRSLELIGQIIHATRRKPTNIYCCPKCNATYVKNSKLTYKRLTPYYFVSDL